MFYGALAGLIILLAACNSDRIPVNSKTRRGNLHGTVRISTGDSVLLVQNIEKDGYFTTNGTISEPGFYLLELFENTKSGKNEFLVYLNDEPVQIRFNVSNPKLYPEIFNHSKYQADIQKYYSKLNPLLEVADLEYRNTKTIISHEIEKTGDDDKLVKLTGKLKNAETRRNLVLNDVTLNYIVNNRSSLLSAYLITRSETEINNNAALYNDLYNNLTEKIKNSKYGIRASLLVKKALNRSRTIQ